MVAKQSQGLLSLTQINSSKSKVHNALILKTKLFIKSLQKSIDIRCLSIIIWIAEPLASTRMIICLCTNGHKVGYHDGSDDSDAIAIK